MTVSRPLSVLAVLAAPLVLGGCDSGFGPGNWSDVPDTLTVFSLTRPELAGQPSAVDLIAVSQRRSAVVTVESPGSSGTWDLAVAEESGSFVFLPAGLFPGITDRNAGLVPVSGTLEALEEAPEDSTFVTDRSVPAVTGQVYALRSRAARSCVYYGKMDVLEADAASGRVQIRVVVNPFCSIRDLIPPEDDG